MWVQVMLKAKINAFIFSSIVAFGGFVFGLDIALISGTFKYIAAEFNLTALQMGNVAGAPGWGALLALVFAGYFCDKFGRKNTLIIIAALYLVSAIGSACAVSYETLFFARFLGGLAFTSLTLASMYIREIAPPALRGKLVGLNQMNIVVGIFIAQLLNLYIVQVIEVGPDWAVSMGLLKETSWRWMLGLEIIPAGLWFLLLFLIPESPRWLMLNGHQQKAEKVIARIMPNTMVRQQFEQIRDSLKDAGHSLSLREQLAFLANSKVRVALIIGVGIAIVQSLTGMNAVLGFMPMIFSQLGGGDNAAFEQTVWVGGVGMCFTFLALLMIDRLGRRPILLGGLTWISISMAVVAYGFSEATYVLTPDSLSALAGRVDVALLQPMLGVEYLSDLEFKRALELNLGRSTLVALEADLISAAVHMQSFMVFVGIISFVAAFNFSIGPVMWILFSEVFATKVRAVAIPACAFVSTVFGGIIVPSLFPWQLENQGAATTFWIYVGCCVLGLIFCYRLVPETKNKTIEQIESELSQRG
jgi:sugar porter (SP) family MFS transporter